MEKALLTASTAAATADQVQFYQGTSYQTYWLQSQAVGSRWVLSGDANLINADATLIPPGKGFLIRVIKNPARPHITTVQARETPFVRPLVPGYSLIANPWPLAMSPASAGMIQAPFIDSTRQTSADQIELWNGDFSAGQSSWRGWWLCLYRNRNRKKTPGIQCRMCGTTASGSSGGGIRCVRSTFAKFPHPMCYPLSIR